MASDDAMLKRCLGGSSASCLARLADPSPPEIRTDTNISPRSFDSFLIVDVVTVAADKTMATSTEEEPKDVTSNEEKELRRVYDYLANYYPKSKLMKQMEPKLERKHKIMQFKKNPEAVKLVDENGAELTNDQIDAELARIEEECEILQEEIDAYNSQAAKKVSAADLQEALKHLGKKATKVEICADCSCPTLTCHRKK